MSNTTKQPNDEVNAENAPTEKTDWDCYQMKDPKTGFSYDIPYLKFSDPEYLFKYIDYMKLKEKNPEEFEKILRWD
jgi:hypothetical protein